MMSSSVYLLLDMTFPSHNMVLPETEIFIKAILILKSANLCFFNLSYLLYKNAERKERLHFALNLFLYKSMYNRF